jgi:peptidoglycan/LPS O-acetylase OafA/YrhL
MLYGGGAVLCAHRWAGSTAAGRTTVEYLGARSYSIYIVHFPFVTLIACGIRYGWPSTARVVCGRGAVAAVAFGCLCPKL